MPKKRHNYYIKHTKPRPAAPASFRSSSSSAGPGDHGLIPPFPPLSDRERTLGVEGSGNSIDHAMMRGTCQALFSL